MKRIVTAIIGVFMILGVYISDDTALSLKDEIDKAVARNSLEHGVETALLYAIMKKESQTFVFSLRNDKRVLERQAWFNKAVEAHGLDKTNFKTYCSMGLTQILYVCAYDMGFRGSYEDLMRPDINIMYASMLIKKLQVRFKGNIKDIISAYNNGGAYFKDLDGDGIHDENELYYNQKYVDEVYAYYRTYGGVK